LFKAKPLVCAHDRFWRTDQNSQIQSWSLSLLLAFNILCLNWSTIRARKERQTDNCFGATDEEQEKRETIESCNKKYKLREKQYRL